VGTAARPAGEVQKGLVVARTPHNCTVADIHHRPTALDLIQSDLVLNLASAGQARGHFLDQAGHVSLGHVVAQRGAKQSSLLNGIHSTRLADMLGRIIIVGKWRGEQSQWCLESVVTYGKERGVRIWLWYHFNDFIDSSVYNGTFP